MSGVEIAAIVLGSFGSVGLIGSMVNFCRLRFERGKWKTQKEKLKAEINNLKEQTAQMKEQTAQMKEQTKKMKEHANMIEKNLPVNRLRVAREVFKEKMKNDLNKFDVEKKYHPFYENTKLEDVIRNEMCQENCSDGGVVVVAGPKNSGKSTRVHHVAKKLLEQNKIRGAVSFDCSNVKNPREMFLKYFQADDDLVLWDGVLPLIPQASPEEYSLDNGRRAPPIIIIFDQIEKLDVSGQKEFLDLIFDMATKSIKAPTSKDFLSFVVCSDFNFAKKVLKLNDNRKIRLPMRENEISKYKWSKNDCEELIRMFENKKGCLKRDTKELLVQCAYKSGTPGFIRNFFQPYTSFENLTTGDVNDFTKANSDEKNWEKWIKNPLIDDISTFKNSNFDF